MGEWKEFTSLVNYKLLFYISIYYISKNGEFGVPYKQTVCSCSRDDIDWLSTLVLVAR